MTTAIPSAIKEAIEHRFGSISAFSFAGGGCINKGGKLTLGAKSFFLKWNDAVRFPGMFAAEAKGLFLLAQCKSLIIPDVIISGTAGTYQFLLLEFIAEGSRSSNYWDQFGAGLASLHRITAEKFGLDHDNYIGSLPQSNTEGNSWIEFFAHKRLEFQLQMAIDAGRLELASTRQFNGLLKLLPSLLSEERPSLLHGDLWGGNVMTTSTGAPCLIDPSVYFGHREVDLAMTQLFGGFDASYFDAYHEAYPLLPGYEERIEVYNLYPLLVHVNLFGGSYARQVMAILNKFAGGL